MGIIRLLGVCSCLLALLSIPTAQAQSIDTLSCDLAELMPDWMRLLPGVRKLQFVKTLTVPAGETSFAVRVCSSGGRDAPAERILSRADTYLRSVSTHVGLHYLGSRQWTIMIVERDELPENVLGVTNPADGIVWLPIDVDDWTLIHELSHFWANDDHFIDPWMSEGYAEYVTEQVVAEFSLRSIDLTPEPICTGRPLTTWDYQPRQTVRCGYDVGAAVFRDLAKEIGATTLRSVLADTNGRIDSMGMLRVLEHASGKDLSAIMLSRQVFPASMNSWFEQRRNARASLAETQQLAQTLGYQLSAEYALLVQNEQFAEAVQQLAGIKNILQRADLIRQECTKLKLACSPIWQQPDSAALTNAQLLLERYRPLADAVQQHNLPMPDALRQAVAVFDPLAIEQIHKATVVLKQGIEVEQLCANALACRSWREDWSAGTFDVVSAALTGLQVLLNQALQMEQDCTAARTGCHQIWQAALQEGGTDQLQRVLQDVHGLLNAAPVLSQRCAPLQAHCDAAWRTPLSQGDLQAALQAGDRIRELLIKASAVEQRCAAAGWPCPLGWRMALQNNSLPAALQILSDTDAALVLVQSATAGIDQREPNGALALIESLTARSPSTSLAAAREAFNSGKIKTALYWANEARTIRERTVWASLGIVVFLIIGVSSLWIRRRSPRRAQPLAAPSRANTIAEENDALLADLLNQLPNTDQRSKRSD